MISFIGTATQQSLKDGAIIEIPPPMSVCAETPQTARSGPVSKSGEKTLPRQDEACAGGVHFPHNKSTGLVAFIHHHVVAAPIVPNQNQRFLVTGFFGQMHGVIGTGHRVMIDLFDHIPGLQTGIRRS